MDERQGAFPGIRVATDRTCVRDCALPLCIPRTGIALVLPSACALINSSLANMDTELNSTSPTATKPTASPVTPFPSARPDTPAPTPATTASVETAKDAGATLLRRATQGAHDAIDGLSAKVSGVASGAQDKVDRALQARDEWTTAARDAVREHPLLALGGALLVGAALNALMSSRRDR